MPAYRLNTHAVEASRIETLQPLVSQGKVLAPDNGLTLILEDHTKHNWIAEKDGQTPLVGDFLVHDAQLHVTYVVAAHKFTELFHESTEVMQDGKKDHRGL